MHSWLRIALLLVLGIFIVPLYSFAHGGGQDQYGCHNDRKHGGYHCHRGSLAGKSFSSQKEMLSVLKDKSGSQVEAKPRTKEKVCVREEQTGREVCGTPTQ